MRVCLRLWLWIPILLLAGCGGDGGGGNQANGNNTNQYVPCLCGDGVRACAEECDEGEQNSDTRPDACRTDCTLSRCGDGVTDSGEDCDQGALNADTVPDRCRSHCQPPRCGDGVVDALAGETCDDGNTEAGDGCSPLCLVEYCGNGVVDPGEECDDGNYLPGDGCGPTCQREECGNGFVDPGETCDEWERANHDGCSSDCHIEIPRWFETLGGAPSGRAAGSLTLDPARGGLLLFGGMHHPGGLATDLDDTWVYASGRWHRQSPEASPLARRNHATAFDPVRGVVLLFGGQNGSTALGDTWEWNGRHWRQRTPAQNPPARSGHGLAFDPVRGTILLFGGYFHASGQGHHLNDTWEWDGQSWHALSPVNAPSVRRHHRLTTDPLRGRILMFGGEEGSAAKNDTWIWDGVDWEIQSPTLSPPVRRSAVQVFDPSRGAILLNAGSYDDGVTRRFLTDTWEWDGAQWSHLVGAVSPVPDLHEAMAAFDLQMGAVVLFGGSYYASGVHYYPQEVWAWDGAGFSAVAAEAAVHPSPRADAAVAFDLNRGEVLLFGGWYQVLQATCHGDTWVHGASGWHTIDSMSAPSARSEAAMAYDPARDETVLFGGKCSTTVMMDTWVFSPMTRQWDERFPATSPPQRFGHAVVADAARGEMLLFGGLSFDASTTYYDDTWIWDGMDWSLMSPTEAPAPRRGHAMVWDPERQEVLLFGGESGGPNQADTWSWDGATWTRRVTPVAPPARRGHRLVFDASRRSVLLHGGIGLGGVFGDLWEWDGSSWTALIPAVRPPAREGHVLVHDLPLQRTWLLGGRDGSTFHPDRWFFQRAATGSAGAICLSGFDGDGDGLLGCLDPDCGGYCDPHCQGLGICDGSGPRCGDGHCDPLETCRLCPADCGACPPLCGDSHCDAGENAGSCPGDCF